MKKCNKCGEIKLETEFYKDKINKDGLRGDCKVCKNKKGKKWRKNNLEKYNKYQKEYKKKYKKNNLEKIKEYQKEYQKKYRKNNLEKIKKYQKEWKENNLEKYKKSRKKTYIRLSKIPSYRINISISSGIRKSLKRNKNGMHWETTVGYTIEELIAHLEAQFEDWMNWDNYGEWHIDHIKPQSLFNFTSVNDKEFKECWALENLQPLEATENIIKSNKYTKI